MYGVPSGIVWDPAGGAALEDGWIEEGFIVAAADVALALPPVRAGARRRWDARGDLRRRSGRHAGRQPPRRACARRAGLEGDRHVVGTGTFPSGMPGSALTIIAAEVCESFDPPLAADEHRRNLVTRGIDLNALVGHEFTIGDVRCRGHAAVRAVHGGRAAMRRRPVLEAARASRRPARGHPRGRRDRRWRRGARGPARVARTQRRAPRTLPPARFAAPCGPPAPAHRPSTSPSARSPNGARPGSGRAGGRRTPSGAGGRRHRAPMRSGGAAIRSRPRSRGTARGRSGRGGESVQELAHQLAAAVVEARNLLRVVHRVVRGVLDERADGDRPRHRAHDNAA